MDKQYCERLYQEYVELSETMKRVIEAGVAGKSSTQLIDTNELIRKEELRKKLLQTCKPFLQERLTQDQLFEMENG